MNKIKTLIILLLVAISGANAQIITLNYNDFSSNECDVFASPIPVQGILHETKVGDITKNSSVGAIQLKYEYNNGGSNQKGSEFAITYYNFKKDYKYRVKITARNNNSYSVPAGIKCNFNVSGIDFQCNGPNYLTNNNGTFSSSNNWFQTVNGTSFTEYTFESDYLSSAQTNLGIGTYSLYNIGQNSEWNQTIYIKKIEIIELPPPPSFSLSPTTLSLGCGDVSQRTFTVTPSNIPSGAIVTYNWSHPGWTLVSSTTTSRTLVPTSSTILPSNVTVTPSINGVSQPTKTCVVTRANFSNTASIDGANIICIGNNSSYTINGLGAGNTVTWSSSNTAVATVSGGTQSQVTVNGLSNGIVDLIATITNPCGQTAPPIIKTINIGAPVLSGNVVQGELWVRTNFYPQTLTFPAVLGATSYNWVLTPDTTDFPLVCPATGAAPAKFNNNLLTITTTTPSATALFGNCIGNYTVTCTVSNICGSTIAYQLYVTVGNSGTSPCDGNLALSKTFTISQNPIKNGDIKIRKNTDLDIKNIDLVDDTLDPSIVSGDQPCYQEWPKVYNGLRINNNQPKNSKSNPQFEVKIFDFYGKEVYTKTIDVLEKEISIKDSNLASGKYILHINDGIKIQKEIIIIE